MNRPRRVRDAITWPELWSWLVFYLNVALAAAGATALLLVFARPAPGELRLIGFFVIVCVGYYMVRDVWRWWRYGP
jgi:hypothetical protein